MPVPADWSSQLREFLSAWKAKQSPGYDPYLGDDDTTFPRFVHTEQAGSWNGFVKWLSELDGSWCFRGQREAGWLLHTSLDRAVRRSGSSESSSWVAHLDREKEGRELLFRFQQQAHHYIQNLPSPDDLSSWLALMQHHGAPTRYLDWTLSQYVAVYFGIEDEAKEGDKRSAIWAIDLGWLERKTHELLRPEARSLVLDDPKTRAEHLNNLLGQTEKPLIVRMDPPRINERMAAQQGFFLCKLYHQATFS
jgi:hypothetical protein